MARNWTPSWTKADYVPWLAPGAKERAEAEYGPGLDRGAIREGVNGTEILWEGARWIPFRAGSRGHIEAANAFARIGPGWAGGHHPDTVHASGDGYYEAVTGKRPDPMLGFDLNFNEALFREWQRKATGLGGSEPGAPTPGGADIARLEAKIDTLLGKIDRLIAKG